MYTYGYLVGIGSICGSTVKNKRSPTNSSFSAFLLPAVQRYHNTAQIYGNTCHLLVMLYLHKVHDAQVAG